MPQLTVSTPTHNTPYKLLKRAASSVLASSDVDLRLVIVRDGGDWLKEVPDDPRLVVFELPENMGRYFADAVVTTALDDGFWCPLDSDDWVEPEHYARMIKVASRNGAACSRYWRHQTVKPGFIQEPARASMNANRAGFAHLFHWCSGMYSMDRVRLAGGIHPGYRVGFDTMFAMMLALTGPIDVCNEIGYHWCRRAHGSLTTSPLTRFGSPARAQAKAQLRALWEQAYRAKDADPAAVVRASIDRGLQYQVDKQADRLRRVLDGGR